VLDYDIGYKDAAERLKRLESGGDEQELPEAAVVELIDEVDADASDEVVAIDASLSHLEELSLFESLSLDDLRALAGVAETRAWEAGEVVIAAGGKSVGLVIVTSGMLEVKSPSAGGQILAWLSAGEHVGEMSLIDDAPTSADVVAAEESAGLVLPAEAVRNLLESRPALALRFYQLMAKTLVQRLRDTTARVYA
jgi:CRP-like cAMP-binding protein